MLGAAWINIPDEYHVDIQDIFRIKRRGPRAGVASLAGLIIDPKYTDMKKGLTDDYRLHTGTTSVSGSHLPRKTLSYRGGYAGNGARGNARREVPLQVEGGRGVHGVRGRMEANAGRGGPGQYTVKQVQQTIPSNLGAVQRVNANAAAQRQSVISGSTAAAAQRQSVISLPGVAPAARATAFPAATANEVVAAAPINQSGIVAAASGGGDPNAEAVAGNFPKKRKKCFRCGLVGHLLDDCPAEVCDICEGLEHAGLACPLLSAPKPRGEVYGYAHEELIFFKAPLSETYRPKLENVRLAAVTVTGGELSTPMVISQLQRLVPTESFVWEVSQVGRNIFKVQFPSKNDLEIGRASCRERVYVLV